MDGFDVRDFRAVLRKLEQLAQNQVDRCCLNVTTAQCIALLEIENQEKTTTMAVARALGLEKSTMSRTIEKLVSKSLVTRATNQDDRRITDLELTAAGANHCQNIHDQNDDYFLRVFDLIPDDEKQVIVHSLQQLTSAMETVNDTRINPDNEND